MARGSRLGQRPVSTWTMNSFTIRLNWSGSSRLMVWPQLGITDSADVGISRFIMTDGARQGQSSSPVRIRVGVVILRMPSTRS